METGNNRGQGTPRSKSGRAAGGGCRLGPVRAIGARRPRPVADLVHVQTGSWVSDRDPCGRRRKGGPDLPGAGPFDKVGSVGMVEHVGADLLPDYFGAIRDVLKPGGLFLNHGIVSLRPAREGRWRRRVGRGPRSSFMQRYVFPDGELLTPAENIAPGEAVGLELRDVENLREHYVHTLRSWVRRLEDRAPDAIDLVGAGTYRVWRLYMAASARLLARGDLGLVQALWAKPRADGTVSLPPDRSDLYVGHADAKNEARASEPRE